MRKKILSLALALALCLGLTVPVFAETYTEDIDGITVTANSNGTLSYTGTGVLTELHMDYGEKFIVDLIYGRSKTVTISIGPGITYDGTWLTKMKERLSNNELTVTFSNSSTAAAQTVGGFTDVKMSDYFAAPVVWAVDRKITAGTSATTFSPNQNCTVAQILTFLYRAYGSPKVSGNNPFTDVKESDWYYNAACWAYGKNIVPGGTFGGNRPCTRAMAVTYMWKAAGSPFVTSPYGDFTIGRDGTLREYLGSGGDVVIPDGVTRIGHDVFKGCEDSLTSVTIPSSVTSMNAGVFTDCIRLTDVYWEGSKEQNEWAWASVGVRNITNHYNSNVQIPALSEMPVNTGFTDVSATADCAQAVAWAVEKEVTSGTSATTFSPDSVCTRAQIVSFLYRAMK